MSRSVAAMRDGYVEQLRRFHLSRYRAYREGRDSPDLATELGETATPLAVDTLLPAVREAYEFYRRHFEETDLGSARPYRVPVAGRDTYAVRVRTDGDDGFLEVYDAKGALLLAGRTYIEVVAWGTREWLREQATNPGDLPPELQDADTLWGKPLDG